MSARRELCRCGHPASAHGLGRESCWECSCRLFRRPTLEPKLGGVYDLRAARRALRARSGKPLLETKPRD